MSLPLLTAVICFANEGDEVENTVCGIRETCDDAVEILLINDASNDGFDYEGVANKYGCRYLENAEQAGPAHNRHKGMRLAKTPNVILLDAHMRFYEKNWHEPVNAAIDSSPNSLFCTRSLPLKKGGTPSGAPMGHGASLKIFRETFGQCMHVDWNIRPQEQSTTPEIPCVLGGCYAVRREFLLGIGGYRILHRYGGEEPLISVKAWLAGDGCKLINEVEIGHIYRDKAGAPWKDHIKHAHFNRLATARILLDDERFSRMLKIFDKEPLAAEARKVYRSREGFVMRARAELKSLQKRPLEYFLELNEQFRKDTGKKDFG